jgi:putative DNA primase/helicase
MSSGQTQPPLDAALEWAERGFPVLPLHSVDSHGQCSCLKRCTRAGKHPRVAAGTDFAAATTEEDLVREWWARWPEANIGVPTGRKSGLFVVDLDVGGDAWRKAEFIFGHGVWAAAVIVGTGSGGRHFWFARPDTQARLSHGGDGSPFGIEGLHLRCDGGYVVVPPSRNAAGPYSLLEADFDALYPPPADLVDKLVSPRMPRKVTKGAVIRRGQRNATLISYAGMMRDGGMEREEIAAALSEINVRRCSPPLPEAEVKGIAASAAGYEPTRPAGEFVVVPLALAYDSRISSQAKETWAVLASYADWRGPTVGETCVGNARLAKTLGTSEPTVERRTRELEQSGWLTKKPRGARRTSITLLHRQVQRSERGSAVTRQL